MSDRKASSDTGSSDRGSSDSHSPQHRDEALRHEIAHWAAKEALRATELTSQRFKDKIDAHLKRMRVQVMLLALGVLVALAVASVVVLSSVREDVEATFAPVESLEKRVTELERALDDIRAEFSAPDAADATARGKGADKQ